ncbi:V-type ATP synthase subunit E family protein [Candidatus Marsarchaeota archaeon]|nr:V-type ATP synthase subunit E family protein [Candidatus Marsarchaeota archaeon]
MGLEEIVAEINKRKELEVSKILSDARSEASKIIDAAKQKAAEEYKELTSKAEFEAAQIKAREQSKANIEAKRLLYNAISEKLSSAEALLRENIGEYKQGDTYAALIEKLANNCLEELGYDCTIYASADDIKALKKKFPKANLKQADGDLDFGVYAISSDGKRVIDYGLESIMHASRGAFYSRLLKAINGKHD